MDFAVGLACLHLTQDTSDNVDVDDDARVLPSVLHDVDVDDDDDADAKICLDRNGFER